MVTTITDIRVPADAFPLGRILQEYPEVEIELERLVPTQKGIIPLFWIESASEAAVERTLQEDPLVEELAQLTRTPERILYSVTWSPDIDSLVKALVDHNVDVLSAEGTADFWEFRLQFRDRGQLEQFRRACCAEGIPLDLLRLYNPMTPPEEGSLTAEQIDALKTAYEHGFWNIPRAINQTELADLIGISDSSMSQRLRRGIKVTVGESLYSFAKQEGD